MPYLRGVCNFCGTGCGHLLRVENNACRGVFPLPGHPMSKGRLCLRGWHVHELLQTEDRIVAPLVREGDNWKQLALDEAVKMAASRLKAYSGDEIAFLGSPRESNEDNYLFAKLARTVFRTRNLSLSSDGGQEASARVLAEGTGMPAMTCSMENLRKAAFIMVVGGDLTKQNPIVGSEIYLASRAGARLVTISSRRTQMAKLSHLHLRPKPGSTAALIEGMCAMMLQEGLVDRRFLTWRTDGSEEFFARLEAVDAAGVIRRSGVDPEDAALVVRELAAVNTGCAFYPTGIQSISERAMAMLLNLFLMSGKVGGEKGGLYPVTGVSNLLGSYDMGCSPVFLPGYGKIDDGAARARMEKFWGMSLAPGPGRSVNEALSFPDSKVRALVVVDHDEEISADAAQTKELVGKLDFVLYLGAYENKFARLAHMVLPLTTYVEDDGTYTNFERRIQLSEKKIEPRFPVLPLWKAATMIARELGHDWKYGSASDVMTEIAAAVPAYSAVNHDKLRTHQGLKWPCDAGHPLGTKCLEPDALGRRLKFVVPPPDVRPAETDVDHPLMLTAGRTNYFWHRNSIMKKTFIPRREYRSLLLLYPNGFVEVSSEDAARLKLRDKQQVRVISATSQMEVAVRVSPDILPGTVYVPYFIRDMVTDFLFRQAHEVEKNEELFVPVRLEKVG